MTARTVHVVDDDAAIRSSTSLLLRTLGYAVRTWPSGSSFLDSAGAIEPGVVLLDARMPDMDGFAVQRELSALGLGMPVIFFTGHADIAMAVRALKAGAVDFIEKPAGRTRFVEVLRRAFDVFDMRASSLPGPEPAQRLIAELTDREQEVLARLARGLTNKTAAEDLGISYRTIEVHRANIMKKLNARTFSDALRVAFEAGLT